MKEDNLSKYSIREWGAITVRIKTKSLLMKYREKRESWDDFLKALMNFWIEEHKKKLREVD